MKVALVVGVRPEFVQCTQILKKLKDWHEILLIHTGQHYDYQMSKIFFEELNIPEPDYHLNVGSGTQGAQTGDLLTKMETVLLEEKPNMTLVFGDTNSTLAGALAASKLHIKVGHIESGMRSFDRSMPEEINRILTDHCSDLLFCSTKTAVENLKREGIINNVYLVGDVMVDSLPNNKKIAESKSDILDVLKLKSKEYFVVTIHRASNTDDKKNLNNIVEALLEVEETVIFPVHPRTKKFLIEYGLYDKLCSRASIKLIDPLGYLDFLKLMNHAKKIITDSGGIQKEAYILKVPCITLRENTEWIETIQDGWNVLTGPDKRKIIKMIDEFYPVNIQKDAFGLGASRKIVEIINLF